MRNKLIMVLYLVFALAIAVILSSRFSILRHQRAFEDSLIKSMQSTKAQVMGSTISAWTKLNDQFMTEEQVAAELTAIAEAIEIDKSTINITNETNDDAIKHTLHASSGSKYYNISVESIKTKKSGETYVIADVSIDSSCVELTSERQKLEKYFNGRSKKPEINSCIIGVYNGKLEENEMHAKISEALSAVKAKKVEGLATSGLNSISAFSNNINDFVLSNNKKVNMQIAMRYSSYDDKTYIWIGSPLVNMEY